MAISIHPLGMGSPAPFLLWISTRYKTLNNLWIIWCCYPWPWVLFIAFPLFWLRCVNEAFALRFCMWCSHIFCFTYSRSHLYHFFQHKLKENGRAASAFSVGKFFSPPHYVPLTNLSCLWWWVPRTMPHW